MNNFSYLLSFLEGMLTFISPCLLPLLPVYFLYLTGVAEGDDHGRGRLLLNSVAFVLGFSLVFISLGATASGLGRYLLGHLGILRQLSGVVMIIFGLQFMGVLRLRWLNLDRHLDYQIRDLNFLKSTVFGMVFAFGWSPCVGIFLGSALLLASNASSIAQGMLLLLLYSAGLGVPFILSALLMDVAQHFSRGLQKHTLLISIISGLVLIVAGLLIYTDRLGMVANALI